MISLWVAHKHSFLVILEQLSDNTVRSVRRRGDCRILFAKQIFVDRHGDNTAENIFKNSPAQQTA